MTFIAQSFMERRAAERAAAAPPVARVAEDQPRFSIEGSGPLSGRTIKPATKAATHLLAMAPSVSDSVRGVLRLVEQVAGGPAASSQVELDGVAFAMSDAGLAANTVQSLLESDEGLRAQLAAAKPKVQAKTVELLLERKRADANGMLANVTANWMNLGTGASAVLLGKARVPSVPPPTPQDLADTMRIVLHESAHAVDDAPANLPREAMHGVWEALAEARTKTLPQMQAARRVLGLEAEVPDAALAASLTHRPYAAAERVLERSLRVAGIPQGTMTEQRILTGSAPDAVDTIVTEMAKVNGTSEQSARDAITVAFAEAMGGAR